MLMLESDLDSAYDTEPLEYSTDDAINPSGKKRFHLLQSSNFIAFAYEQFGPYSKKRQR